MRPRPIVPLAICTSLLLGCPRDPGGAAPGTTAGGPPAASAAPTARASASGPAASASAIVHQPGTVPPAPSAHKAPGAGPAAPAPTFTALAALDKARALEGDSFYPRFSARGATLGVPFAKGLFVADLAKGKGFIVTTGAAPGGFSFSADGGKLAVSDGSGRTTLWDTVAGTLLRTFPLGGDPVALAPDGSSVAAGGDALAWWDASSGMELLHLTELQVFDLAFTDGGKELVTANSTQVTVYDRAGKQLPGGGGTDTGATFATVLSPTGRWVAASAPAGHGMQVLELHAWSARQLVNVDSCEEHVWPHFADSGRLLFAKGGNRWVKAFEVGTFKPYASYHAKVGQDVVAFADDLTHVVVTRPGADASLVTVETKAEIKLEKALGAEASFTFSADGRYLAGSAGKVVRVWDAKTGKLLHEING
ncbi:MAG: WD40 repeat domain-containing protein [Byssovorax sp.]